MDRSQESHFFSKKTLLNISKGALFGVFFGGIVLASFLNPVSAVLLGGLLGIGLGTVFHSVSLLKSPDKQVLTKEAGKTYAPSVSSPAISSPTMQAVENTPQPITHTPQQAALIKLADTLGIPCSPEEIPTALPPTRHTERATKSPLSFQKYADFTEDDRNHLNVLAAYSRGEVTDDAALAAYRNLRREVGQPLIEEGLKIGINSALHNGGVTGPSAEVAADILAKPLSETLSVAVDQGMVEKTMAAGTGGLAVRVAANCVARLFPERPVKQISGQALELDLARTIGNCANLAQHRTQPAMSR